MNCSDCDSKVKLDESLLNLSAKQRDLLIKKASLPDDSIILPSPPDYIEKTRLDLYHKASALVSDSDTDSDSDYSDTNSFIGLDDSFVLIPDEESNSISGRIKTLTKVFQILSSTQPINHPLSAQCAEILIESYKQKFDRISYEKDKYLSFLKKLKESSDINFGTQDIRSKDDRRKNDRGQRGELPKRDIDSRGHTDNRNIDDQRNKDKLSDQSEIDSKNTHHDQSLDEKLVQSTQTVKELESKLQDSLELLKSLEVKKNALQEDLVKYKEELRKLNETKLTNYYEKQNEQYLEMKSAKSVLDQHKSKYDQHLKHLDKLRNFNIYTQLFKIEFDQFPMINSFRLGYKIINQEVNSALGQVLLLLKFVIKRLKLKLDQYHLVPLGSKSYIIKSNVDGVKSQLNLFTSNEFLLGRLFNFNKLDVALLALIDVIRLIEKRIKGLDAEIELPYTFNLKNGTIGGKSIRITLNAEWTDGCRFMLVNLNWILLWISTNTE